MSDTISMTEDMPDNVQSSPKSISSTRTMTDLDLNMVEEDHLEQILILFSSLEFSSEELKDSFDSLLIESYAKLFALYIFSLPGNERTKLKNDILKNVSRICISESTLPFGHEEEALDHNVTSMDRINTIQASESSEKIVLRALSTLLKISSSIADQKVNINM